MTALLTAVCANAATPDAAPTRSVKNVKLKISPNGRYFVDQNGKPFLYLHLSKLNGSPVKAQWYDPRDGTWKTIGQYPNKGVHEFSPPSRDENDDWVLVLDATP